MKLSIRPTRGNVLIAPDPDPAMAGRIFIPEQIRNRDMPSIGTVLAIGGRLKTKKGVLVEPEFKPGDKVLFRKFSGLFVDFRGKRFVQVKIHDIEAVIT